MSDLVINTSWSVALLCFVLAAFNMYFAFLNVGRAATGLVSISWFVLGLCYVLTQFGGSWFLLNQRAYFRLAMLFVLSSQLYAMYSMYNSLRPLIEVKRRANGFEPDGV